MPDNAELVADDGDGISSDDEPCEECRYECDMHCICECHPMQLIDGTGVESQ